MVDTQQLREWTLYVTLSTQSHQRSLLLSQLTVTQGTAAAREVQSELFQYSHITMKKKKHKKQGEEIRGYIGWGLCNLFKEYWIKRFPDSICSSCVTQILFLSLVQFLFHRLGESVSRSFRILKMLTKLGIRENQSSGQELSVQHADVFRCLPQLAARKWIQIKRSQCVITFWVFCESKMKNRCVVKPQVTHSKRLKMNIKEIKLFKSHFTCSLSSLLGLWEVLRVVRGRKSRKPGTAPKPPGYREERTANKQSVI